MASIGHLQRDGSRICNAARCIGLAGTDENALAARLDLEITPIYADR